MADRFYCPDLSQPVTELSDSEAHHAIHVLRLKESQSINLFDGAGKTATGIIRSVGRSLVSVEVRDLRFHNRREDVLTVAAAVPKGDRLKWMIEKLTELGVDRYVPLCTTNSVVNPRQQKIEKLKTTVVNAAKQSGQNWLMRIDSPTDFARLLQESQRTRIFIAHPDSDGSVAGFNSVSAGAEKLLLVGPEGGFTVEELLLAEQAGGTKLSLPGSTLRIETAAVTIAAIMRLRSHSSNTAV